MSKTTILSITQDADKATIVQVDVIEDGELNPRLSSQNKMGAEQVIALICQIYDKPYNHNRIIAAKNPYKCKHCHKTFLTKVKCCDRCAGKVKKND